MPKRRILTPPADARPDLAGGAPRFPVEDLVHGEAIADPLQHAQRIEEVGLAAGVRADEDVQRLEIQRHFAQAFEAVDLEVADHARSRLHTIWPFTTVATGPPWKVLPWNGELRLREGD